MRNNDIFFLLQNKYVLNNIFNDKRKNFVQISFSICDILYKKVFNI